MIGVLGLQDIWTDVELGLFLRVQQREFLELFAQACDEAARQQDEASGYAVFAGAARAILRGEDPVAVQRLAIRDVPDFYEDGGNE